MFEQETGTVHTGEDLRYLAVPCGGIGAGQLDICGNGKLGSWWIFDQSVDHGFAVAIDVEDGNRLCRTPGTGTAQTLISVPRVTVRVNQVLSEKRCRTVLMGVDTPDTSDTAHPQYGVEAQA